MTAKYLALGLVGLASILLLVGYDGTTGEYYVDVDGVPGLLCEIPMLVLNEFVETDIEGTNLNESLKERWDC